MILLEKAFAKFAGGYQNLVGGNALYALMILIGSKKNAVWLKKEGETHWKKWIMSKTARRSADDDASHYNNMQKPVTYWDDEKGDEKYLWDKLQEQATANYLMS